MSVRLGTLYVVAAFALCSVCAGGARAEPSEIRIAQQYGVNYLPLLVMKKNRLVEKQAQAAGLGSVTVTWTQFGSGAAMNDALIAGSLDFASGGVGPLIKIWDRVLDEL